MIKYILLVLVVGVVLGYVNNSVFGVVPSVWFSGYVFNGALLVLLFVMGLAFGMDKEAVNRLRVTGLRILVIPVVVALGSFLGGLVGGLLFGLNVFGSMAVTGWVWLVHGHGTFVDSGFGFSVGCVGVYG